MMQNKNEDNPQVIKGLPVDKNADTASEEAADITGLMDDEKEEQYNKVIKLMKSIKCMTPCKDKVKMYKDAAQKFTDLSGYKDSELYAKKCKKKAKKTKEEIKKVLYDRAVSVKSSARTSEEYLEAGTKFRKAKGYLDAETMAQECEAQQIRMEKKKSQKKVLQYGVAFLCAIAVVFAFIAPSVKYVLAGADKKLGLYNTAIQLYTKLGSYKDSEDNLTQSRYLYGLRLESKGKYSEAVKLFAAVGEYKDSEVKTVHAQKQIIKESKIGKSVVIGGSKWVIIDKSGEKALLMIKSAIKGMDYNDRLENVTWESSSLRALLNSKYLEDTFTQAERDNIALTNVINEDNEIYGTDGGKDTQDYIFLFSAKEAEKYQKVFPKFKTNGWLRTPGYNQNSAAFLSSKRIVMNYGYGADSKDYTVRPVFWYKLN